MQALKSRTLSQVIRRTANTNARYLSVALFKPYNYDRDDKRAKAESAPFQERTAGFDSGAVLGANNGIT